MCPRGTRPPSIPDHTPLPSKLILSLPLCLYEHFCNATQQFSALPCPSPTSSPHFPPSVNTCWYSQGKHLPAPRGARHLHGHWCHQNASWSASGSDLIKIKVWRRILLSSLGRWMGSLMLLPFSQQVSSGSIRSREQGASFPGKRSRIHNTDQNGHNANRKGCRGFSLHQPLSSGGSFVWQTQRWGPVLDQPGGN